MIIIRLITLIINDGYCSAVSLEQKNEVTYKPVRMQSDSVLSSALVRGIYHK